jgi:carboxyl-terminal processing protease
MRGRRRLATILACALGLAAGKASSAEDPPLLRNGALDAWEGGAPVGWSVEQGAGATEGPGSVVTRAAPEGGLRLRGDAGVRRWRMVVQPVAARAGTTYRLSFEARASGLRLDRGQTENAYVGVRLGGSAGRPAFEVASVGAETWTPGEVVFRGTGDGDRVIVFLSKTGVLEVRSVALEELSPKGSLDVLARNLGRYYAHFPARPGLDWPAAVEAHRARFPEDVGAEAFAAAAKDLLARLEDPHVWIRVGAAPLVVAWNPPVPRNVDFAVVAKSLEGARRIGRVGLAGELPGEVGYLAVATLEGPAADFPPLAAALDERLDRRALVLDLRANGGGEETRALDLVSRLADKPRLYARRLVRTGAAPNDLGGAIEAWVRPREGKRFAGPIAVLVGPGCMSSGEGMAQMLRVLPNAVFVGKPTRGASGNPRRLPLPNGVDVWYSSWWNLLPDGTPTEGRGVVPDVAVVHEGEGDPTLAAALVALRERLR